MKFAEFKDGMVIKTGPVTLTQMKSSSSLAITIPNGFIPIRRVRQKAVGAV